MTAHPAAFLAEARRAPGRSLISLGVLIALAITPAIFAPALYDDFTLPKQASILVAAACILAGLAMEGEFLPRHRAARLLLLGWVALLVVSFATGIDRRGSLLGYYQYRQGLLTQFGFVALFLGAVSLARRPTAAWPAFAGLLGLGCVTFYTAVQSLGLDPVNWWTDTSVRAIGTIGNANELGAYAVIALAFCALGQGRSPRAEMTITTFVAACSAFILLESESRSGLLALAVAFVAYPIGSVVIRQPWRAWSRRWLLLACGIAVGALLSLAAGGAAGTASRVQTGLHQQEASGSTRMELWKGTLATISESPLSGFGPDGLHLAFPRYRPADLGGAFLDYDLVAQSSHNAVLDIAANEGLPALVAIVALLALVAVRSVRHERTSRGDSGVPFLWAALAGYVALTMLNPVSLAAHALFFLLAGTLLGRSERPLPQPLAPKVPARARLLLASPAVVALVAIAILLPTADFVANRAWEHYARGEFATAAGYYKSASKLLPFERSYAESVADSWLAAGVTEGRPALLKSVSAY
ncbi:MAG: O-antigen ligase family protein, partial [Tepidiformaceae bacterium]